MANQEIQLPSPEFLHESSPQARQTYTGPDGRRNTVIDTRPPLHRMRRRELMKLAHEAGFDVSSSPRADDLRKMLEMPRSVRAQLKAGKNLAQAREGRADQPVAAKVAPAPQPLPPPQPQPQPQPQPITPRPAATYQPREPEPHEVEAARAEARASMVKMPFFKLKAVLGARGIDYVAGGDRGALIDQYLKKVEQDEGSML